MNKMTLIYIALVIFTACTSTTKKSIGESENVLRVQNPLDPQDLFLSKMVDSISIVRLETTDKSLIGRISNIKFYKDKIFIADDLAQQLLIFDKEGNFLKSLHAIGQGPGEYINLSDFAVDGDFIYILDFAGRSILVYDLELSFEKAIKVTNLALNIEVLNNEIWLYNGYGQTFGDDFELTHIDSMNKEHHYLKRKKHEGVGIGDITLWGDGNVFSVCNESIFYSEKGSSQLFELKGDSTTAILQIDFGKYTIPESTNIFLHESVFYGNEFPYIVRNNFAVSDKYVIIRFYDGAGRVCYAFWDKKNKVTAEGVVINDIISNYNRFVPDFGDDNILVEVVSPPLIFDEEFKGIVDFCPSLKDVSEEDNYILIKYHLKQ